MDIWEWDRYLLKRAAIIQQVPQIPPKCVEFNDTVSKNLSTLIEQPKFDFKTVDFVTVSQHIDLMKDFFLDPSFIGLFILYSKHTINV